MLLLAACVGLISGVTSGLCGVSLGGALVVLANLLLGTGQHVAQGLSLIAQIPPTSLTGVKRYQTEGHGISRGWLPWLASGFLVGAAAGAICAAHVSNPILQWSYVGYLGVLEALLILRSTPRRLPTDAVTRLGSIPRSALLMVGLLAGLSSGYLGIGGGLAIVVGLTSGLKIPQHQAQHLSLVLSIIPITTPAAYVYWREGLLPSWPILAAVIVGLWGGITLGARAANHVRPAALRRALMALVAAMAACMAWKAL
jgi:hypothetical protein